MTRIKKTTELEELAGPELLTATDRQLLEEAGKAVELAYAPYSGFKVGCAVRLANGTVVRGNNQENVAFPSGLCAERVAIFHAGASFPDVAIESMAITARSSEITLDHPVLSCGACLQAMIEYEQRSGKPIRIILRGESGPVYLANGTETFMPFQFRAEGLKK